MSNKIFNLLIVDDIKENLFSLEALLTEEIENISVAKANSGLEALSKVREIKFDLIILDIQMPEMDGFEVAELLKGAKKTKDIPIVFLTAAYKSDSFKEKGFQIGAIDYLTKPIDENQLINRINLYLKVFEKEKELQAINQKLNEYIEEIKRLSVTDELTNLFNRRHFNELFVKERNRAIRDEKFFSFILIDVDNFKLYNDTYGHQAGDFVLKEVGATLKKSLHRGSDFAFRLGGEEFGIIFSGLNEEKSLEFSNQIREKIEDLKIKHEKNSASEFVTASMGLYVGSYHQIEESDSIYRYADEALYLAKESGRNRVILHESEIK